MCFGVTTLQPPSSDRSFGPPVAGSYSTQAEFAVAAFAASFVVSADLTESAVVEPTAACPKCGAGRG